MNLMEKQFIELSHVTKSFPVAACMVQALKDVNLSIGQKEMIAITGKSGSGKSTLLNIITGIDKPTGGAIIINAVRIDKLSESELASWRGKNIRGVFQFFQLLPTLTIAEKIMLPMDFCYTSPNKQTRARARALLEQ